MAVATTVIERRFSQQINEREERGGMNADELHNARMKDNLARLLNPEYKIKDVVASIDTDGSQVIKSAAPAADVSAQPAAPAQLYEANGIIARRAPAQQEYVQPVQSAPVYQQPAQSAAQPVYMVKNARANADIFRADSPVNRPAQAYAPTPAQAYAAARSMAAAQAAPAVMPAEEESDDLRPTATTIQYQTISADGTAIAGRTRTMQEGEIARPAEREESESKINLTKRDKIIIGVIVGLILAVFVLIIVNSAIISNLNSDISRLEGMADTARAAYESAYSEVENVTSYENVYNVALEQGWIS